MKNKSSFYHPELDVLRLVAFLQVFYFHVGKRYIQGNGMLLHHGLTSRYIPAFIQAGSTGVDLFFCLSSFLITALLLRECDLNGTLDIKQFWMRRILRIWPLYFSFLAVAVFILPHFDGLGESLSHGYVSAFALFCGNWACVFHGVPLSAATPLWSVPVEEQFYVLWPLLLFTFKPKRLVFLAIGGLVIASLTRLVLVLTGADSHYEVVWMNTLTRLDPIAIGALCAVAARKWPWRPTLRTRAMLGVFGLLVPALMICVMGFESIGRWILVVYPLVGVCCVCLLGAIYRDEPVRMPSFAVYLGRISYGLYVFHVLAIAIANKVPMISGQQAAIKIANAAIFVTATSVLTLAMAALSYRYLEQWFLKLKSKFSIIQSSPNYVARKDAESSMPAGSSSAAS